MIPARIDDIASGHVVALVAESVSERRTLEYKATLPGGADKEKHDFLADVSSLGNTEGGDIVYGISAKRDAQNQPTGEPEAIVGLPADVNTDAEIRRLEQIVRSGLAPTLHMIEMKAVRVDAQKVVLVVRVHQSVSRPHRINMSRRFYARNSAGCYPIDDMSELRTAFLASESLNERIRDFRTQRLQTILGESPPVVLDRESLAILHLVPATSMTATTRIDPRRVARFTQHTMPVRAAPTAGLNERYNLEGYVVSAPGGTKPARAYTQVFRSGVIEIVSARLVSEQEKGRRLVASQAYERDIIEATMRGLRLLRELDIGPPVYAFLALYAVQGASMAIDDPFADEEPPAFDRPLVVLPEVAITDFDTHVMLTLRPLFDAVWQSAGLPQSLNYDEGGNWVGQRRR